MRKNIEKKPVNKKNTDNRFDNFDYEENREELPFADSKRVIILDEKEDECLILKDVSDSSSKEANYEIVEGEEEEDAYDAFSKILKGDIDLQK